MKKTIRSMIAFLVMSTIVFTAAAPVFALALEDVNVQNTVSAADVPISERYHIIKNGYRGKYDLQEGVFGYQGTEATMFASKDTKPKNQTTVYFYSDGYFTDAPDVYNPSLSTMSLSLAFSAFNAIQTDFDFAMPSSSYTNLFRHVKMLMSDIGIKEKDIFINNGFAQRPTEETIGMIMGAKEIKLDNESYILIPIVVRGGDYETEWASNFHLGTEGESYGFSSAATQVMEQVDNYINSYRSFDISSALSEGKVKFWVVGYSRGGAVANITSKRLTDIYGKTGNSVYGYCFEAPGGGVDSAEIDEIWTYNGVYANIHNVLNSGDLIPHVPPKQMGFKRYGVDHYMPGTEAGEIITSTYETPAGVTVTTHTDNTAYVVGEGEYNEMRDKMQRHLAAIDSKITFSDTFSLVKIDPWGALLNGGILEGKLFKAIDEEANVTSAEWIECLVRDLQAWVANGTYSNGELNNGGYNNDYRDFYTSNSEFAGKEYVTPEVALRCILRLVFANQHDEEFLEAMMRRGISLLLDYMTIIDLYLNAIQKWDDLSEEKQVKYLNKIWDCLNGDLKDSDGNPIKKISDYVEPDEYELLKDSVYALAAFSFLFISKDHKTSPDVDGVNETLAHLSTLIYNIQTVAQGHYPEVCLAWLRTFDENYSEENTNSKYANSEVNLINDGNGSLPEIVSKIEIEDTKTTVFLSSIIKSSIGVDANSENNGAAIYYAVFENGNMVGDWQLYRSPILINTEKDIQYSIKAFAVRFEEKGTELEISNELLRSPVKEPEPDVDDNVSDDTDNKPDENPNEDKQSNSLQIIVISSVAITFTILSIVFITKKQKISKNK